MLSLAVFSPIICGALMLLFQVKNKRLREVLVEGVTLITSALVFYCMFFRQGETATPFYLMKNLPISFHIDGVGSVFTAIAAILWPLAVLYGFEYMEHEGGESHFFPVYLITFGVTLGISTAANILTMYMFYEFLTLCTMPLVMHGTSRDAVHAGRTYMHYMFFGAALAFVGVMIILGFGTTSTFTAGGVLPAGFRQEHPLILQLGWLCALFGFGVKAAIFPLHAWLPKVSVAPTPVTALLHAVAVVKAGVFCIIRATYFCFGAQLLYGTTAQLIAIVMASVTIVYGSTMAVKEHHFKRRLVYSTVSNLSYIVLAVSLLSRAGLEAGLAHMIFHAVIKITLFFTAGAVLVKTGRTQVESLRGLARVMPFTCTVYAIGAIALMGTPFLPGFVSKWLIGSAAIEAGTTSGLVGLAALLISAVLTAIYLMTPAFFMFFRPAEQGDKALEGGRLDPGLSMKLPLFVLAVLIVCCGIFSNQIVTVLDGIAASVL